MIDTGYQPALSLFRANDIRGIASDSNHSAGQLITPELAYHLGRAFGSVLTNENETEVWLCRDARLSSDALHKNFLSGLLECGLDVLDLGVGPTPLLCHAVATAPVTCESAGSGVMITASHNPPEYNGFKFLLKNQPFFGSELATLRDIIVNKQYVGGKNCSEANTGNHKLVEHQNDYIEDLQRSVDRLTGTKVVLDTANGAAGPLALSALEALGLEIVPLYIDMDGRFPNHSPDTGNPKNLRALIDSVKSNQAFAGIALDGDGDRMVAVTEQGDILNADAVFHLFSQDVLERTPGACVVFDVKTSRQLIDQISARNGRPLMTKSGRSFIQSAMLKQEASLAGEFSSHYFFADRWHGCDDGIYAAARLLEICQRMGKTLSQACSLPKETYASSDIYVEISDERKFDLVQEFIAHAHFHDANLVTIDGLRIEYAAGWALVRASNTSPAITLRFEAESPAELQKLTTLVKRELHKLEPGLDLTQLDAI